MIVSLPPARKSSRTGGSFKVKRVPAQRAPRQNNQPDNLATHDGQIQLVLVITFSVTGICTLGAIGSLLA